jgi:protein translocase SEC61 complex gamma subunit
MDLSEITKPMKEFTKNSIRLVKRCTKPDAKEYRKICFQTIVGFSIMGFIGFFVKLIFIPINNIIMGGAAQAATEAAAEAAA